MTTTTMRPNGAGYATGCSNFGGSTNYDSVDDVVADDGSTFVHTGSFFVTRTDGYTTADQSATLSGHTGLTIDGFARAKNDNASSASFTVAVGTRLSTTNAVATPQSTTNGTWNDFTFSNLARPGGGSWTPSDLASLQIVLQVVSDLGNTQCTQVYLTVNSTPPSTAHNLTLLGVGA